jgi:hypothetical protein
MLGLIVLILSGCVEDRQPKTPQFNSGMEKNKEWHDYNKYAKANNQPILDFVATTLKYQPKGKILNYNEFLTKDSRVEVMTKWHNCKSGDLIELKFYMPDGRLYHYEYGKMKKDYSKYTWGRRIYVDGVSPSVIQGEWKVKIFMNNKYVTTKEFSIGNKNKIYKKSNPNITVGVFPFLDNKKMSTWKHGRLMPNYLTWEILNNNSNIKTIPTKLIFKNLSNISIDYETFETFIGEDINSNHSMILNLANKFKMDYIILGKVISAWSMGYQKTKVNTIIIDVSKKKIINEKEINKTFTRSNFNIATSQRSQGIHPQRLEVYKTIYSELEKEIQAF